MIKQPWKDIVGSEQRMISYSSPQDPLIKRIVINSIEMATGRRSIEMAYQELKKMEIHDAQIWQHIFPLLDIAFDYSEADLLKIPSSGPIVLIANHPFGVVDGLFLGLLLSKRREDFKIIVNSVLCREPMLGKYMLPIDFSETKAALQTNISTRNTALSDLSDHKAIAIFPSGGVATAPTMLSKSVNDLEWKNFIIKILKVSKATVIPVFFHGRNSQLFQIASHINANLRLGLLLHEINNKRGKKLKVEIGNPIEPESVKDLKPKELLSFLKNATFDLASR